MPHNIDKLASERTSERESPSEKLQDTFLDKRPTSQWPSYLDEIAVDIHAGIGIGDTGLDKFNFPSEAGSLYRKGMVSTASEHSDLPATVEEGVSAEDLGQLVYLLNRLSYNIDESETGLNNIQRAITAVLEKLLTDSHGRVNPQLSGGNNSTAAILTQLFSDPVVAQQADEIIDRFEETYNQGLLAKLDEPQMMTPLWEHQRDAIDAWAQSDFRGYANMATATGKTVLGLAAIAVQYGRLHPLDEDIDRQRQRRTNRKAKILIVAHNDLILEQWRREFDRHMNIPQDRTQGRDDVELTWGRIHFRTAQSLLNRDHIEYNLVVLDEAHHYANGSGWGKLLDSFENNVLALSGSVDEGGEVDSKLRDRLESTVGPEIKRYNITDAQHDGVIPTFDWRVEYVPTGKTDSEFVEITEKAAVRFDKFRERIETGELTLETDRRLRTHDDIRRFAHTTEGKQLKRDDEGFKEFATTVFSRQTQRWNQSPQLDAVVDTVQRYADNKVVVLTNNNTQIDRIAELLASSDGVPAERIYTVYGEDSSTEQRDTVDSFDEPGRPSVLIGTGDLIGEGVDMQHADVGINMSTGSVNKELIQRIGRVLRNPDGDKQAIFVNLVGIPVKREAQIPEEDGQNLIEDAQQFVAFGERFDNEPTFATASSGISEAIGRLLAAGREQIITLDADGVYDWPDDNDQREQLEGILSDIDSELPSGTDAVLKAWSTVTTDLDDTGPPPEQSGSVDQASPETADSAGQPESTEQTDQSGGVALAVHNRDGDPISDAFVSIVNGDDTTCGRTDKMGQLQVDASFISGTVAVRHPSAGVTTTSLDSPADASRQTITLSETKPHS